MKKTIIIVVSILLSLPFPIFAQDSIRIATEGAYPPFNSMTANGELVGFDVDIARALCDEMNRECEIIAQDWDGIIPSLINNKYDAVVASMSITEERLEIIDFTDPYYSNFLSIVGKTSAGLTLADLDTRFIGAQRSTIGAQWVEDRFGRRGSVRLYDSTPSGFFDLEAGRIDAFICDFAVALEWLKERPELGYVEERLDFDDDVGIGLRKDEVELKAAFNTALREIRENGTYQLINDKYFTFDIF